MLITILATVETMANIEDVWWRFSEGIPVILKKVTRGYAYWEGFDGSKGKLKEAAFIRDHWLISLR